ncbi:MAG: hypothetical protein V2I38_04270, partial [Alcanivoracaceae bacterium]|nr:hypothetical protein [Alcanivoracaceae bacterium]
MRFALLAVIFLLSACQSGRHADYASEDAVTLIFSSDDLAAQPIICIPGEGIRETPMSVGIGGYKILDDLNEAMKKSPEVTATVAPDSPVIAGFRYSQRGRIVARKRCERMVSFEASAGQTYQLRLESSPTCTITATRQEGDSWV